MAMTSAEKSRRYFEKDPDAYRRKKAAYARTPEERAKRIEYMRQWREKNRDKYNEWARQNAAKNRHKYPERKRESHLRYFYNITQADYERMLADQDGKCSICGTDKPTIKPQEPGKHKWFQVDHDHGTGAVRGLLCIRCNTALGWFEKNSAAAQSYLDKHKKGV